MDYRSRQRAPNESIDQTRNINPINVATTTTIQASVAKPSSASSSAASVASDDLLNQTQLSSLQSVGQQTLSSQSSSSQQAMLTANQANQNNNNHHHHQIYNNPAQRLLDQSQRQQQVNKMNQHQRNNMMQQQNNQQNKQRLAASNQQQAQRLISNPGANQRLQANNSISSPYGSAQQQQQHMKHHHQQHNGAKMAPISGSSNLLNHNHGHNHAASLHNSSGDNMTTSSGDQTIDDLQQLAHGYRNPSSTGLNNLVGAAGSKQHLSSSQKLSQYAYGADNPLSPRLHLGAGSTSTSSGASNAGVLHQSVQGGVEQHSGSRFLLGVLFTLAEILLFGVLLLWLYWAFQHDDGLAWRADRKQQFNTHAALMILGFIFLNGQAMLIYRSFQCCTKIYTKVLHALLFLLATSAIGLGLCLAYTAQENVGANNKPIMHFYSLHAWVGLSSISLFALQFSFGFISFLVLLCCDQATSKFRAALLPIHKTFGLIIFSLAISTCLTGLLQTARSRLSSKLGKIDYHELGEAGIVINVIGGCLICLAILMPYIIRNLDIKRPNNQHIRRLTDRRLRLSDMDMRI